MPSTLLYPSATQETINPTSPLPQLLQTPLGLAILEIQGSLNFSQQASGPDTVQPIGRIVFPLIPAGTTPAPDNTKWMKKVQLFIGKNQKLTGEVRKLAKPLGVVRRRENDGENGGENVNGGNVGQSQGDELEIMEVVKYKLYFGSRPEFV
jgi:chromosome transmission fidelity protein 8